MTPEQAAEYGWGTGGNDRIVQSANGPDTIWEIESRGNDYVVAPGPDTIWETESRGNDHVVEP